MIKSSVKYDVDLREPHFLISYSENPEDTWQSIAVLSAPTEKVEDMRHVLLIHDPEMRETLEAMYKELNYYLHELQNPNRINYLIHHSTTMSNVYSKIHFTYIDKIDDSNLLYYVLTDSKLRGFHNTIAVSFLQQQLTNIVINDLFAEAIGAGPDSDQYNKDLPYLYQLLLKELPMSQGFQLQDTPTLVDFSRSIAKLSSMEFCNVLYYLKKIKLIKGGDFDRLLKLYCKIRKNA